MISLAMPTAPSLLNTSSAAARVAMVEQKLAIIGIPVLSGSAFDEKGISDPICEQKQADTAASHSWKL